MASIMDEYRKILEDHDKTGYWAASSTQQRRRELLELVLNGLYALAYIAFVAGTALVIAHFVVKYW
jgi:hypothetical protein